MPASTKVRPPKSVRVLARDIALEAVPGLCEQRGVLGLCDVFNCRIVYDPGFGAVEVKDTLLHEVVHAVDILHNLGMTEEQVRGLATGLLAVLHDNPKFTQFITQP